MHNLFSRLAVGRPWGHLLALTGALLSAPAGAQTPLTGTHYVAANGDDSGPGSLATPWKTLACVNSKLFGPGARILFRAGDSFSGFLEPKGSGASGSPIVIDMYNTGAKPAINGGGKYPLLSAADQAKAPVDQPRSYALHLHNQSHWEINNLEITNFDASEEGKTLAQWEADNQTFATQAGILPVKERARRPKVAVYVSAEDEDDGVVWHTYFTNLLIHGVNGCLVNGDESTVSKDNGGMFINITTRTNKKTYFNGFKVDRCTIRDVDRTGISNRSCWDARTLTSGGEWTPSLNMVFSSNTFQRTGANALIVRYADSPLMDHNKFEYCAIKGSGNAAFNFGTDNAIWQYNEAHHTRANTDDHDAGGLDSDYDNKGTILQYNYLHDNDFGILITGGPKANDFNDRTVFRYNIIRNDGLQPQSTSDGRFLAKVSGHASNTVIHNNTYYVQSSSMKVLYQKQWYDSDGGTNPYPEKGFAQGIDVRNNIFVLEASNPRVDLKENTGIVFSRNLYYSSASNAYVDALFASLAATNENDTGAVKYQSPKLASPGGTHDYDYKITPGSPALRQGIQLPSTPAQDYFGNVITPASQIDLGAHQYTNPSSGARSAAGSNPDIYLLIGQSNMAGRATIGTLDQATLSNVLLFNGSSFVAATNPLNRYNTAGEPASEGQLGPGYTFGRKLAALSGHTIGLVVNAHGGTSIAQWQKGYSGSNDFNLYEAAVSQMRKAMAHGTFKGIIWHQGEADQSRASTYLAQFQQLVADLRRDLGANVPVIAGEIGKWRSTATDINTVIRSIQGQVSDGHYVASDGLNPLGGDLTNPHFNTLSQRVLGERYADKALFVVYNQTPNVATVYTDCNQQGYSTRLPVGSYTREDLESRGIENNTISSLTVSSGYKVTLYTDAFTGISRTYTTTVNCLDNSTTGLANDVSYVRVEAVGAAARPSAATASPSTATATAEAVWSVYPNPASGNEALVSVAADYEQAAELRLLNTMGQVVLTLPQTLAAGQNTVRLPLDAISSGLYLLVLQQDGQRVTLRLTVTH